MSIQPLSNNAIPAYTPPASAKSAPETPSHGDSAATAGASRQDEAKQAATRVDMKEALRSATHKANQAIEGLRSDLKFTVDEETGSNVVKFIDVNTKEVIRQIPAQEMLVIAKRLDELRGLLIKERV